MIAFLAAAAPQGAGTLFGIPLSGQNPGGVGVPMQMVRINERVRLDAATAAQGAGTLFGIPVSGQNPRRVGVPMQMVRIDEPVLLDASAASPAVRGER